MKNIIALAVGCVMLASAATAQTVPDITTGGWKSVTMTYATAGDDTSTNTDDIVMYNILNHKYDVVVKLVNTKVSGTVAGHAYCQGSPDGTNWITLQESGGTIHGTEDTVAYTDASLTYMWSFKNLSFKYLRLNSRTAGTLVAAPVGTLYYRKAEN